MGYMCAPVGGGSHTCVYLWVCVHLHLCVWWWMCVICACGFCAYPCMCLYGGDCVVFVRVYTCTYMWVYGISVGISLYPCVWVHIHIWTVSVWMHVVVHVCTWMCEHLRGRKSLLCALSPCSSFIFAFHPANTYWINFYFPWILIRPMIKNSSKTVNALMNK